MPSRRRCLVVEDEIDVAETLLRELIEREGFSVWRPTAPRPSLDKGEFDRLFLRPQDPMLNGPELYERLQEIRPELVQHMCFVHRRHDGGSMGEFLRNCGRPVLEAVHQSRHQGVSPLVDKV